MIRRQSKLDHEGGSIWSRKEWVTVKLDCTFLLFYGNEMSFQSFFWFGISFLKLYQWLLTPKSEKKLLLFSLAEWMLWIYFYRAELHTVKWIGYSFLPNNNAFFVMHFMSTLFFQLDLTWQIVLVPLIPNLWLGLICSPMVHHWLSRRPFLRMSLHGM